MLNNWFIFPAASELKQLPLRAGQADSSRDQARTGRETNGRDWRTEVPGLPSLQLRRRLPAAHHSAETGAAEEAVPHLRQDELRS